MKKTISLLALLATAPLSLNAAPMYDQDVTSNVIFGTGVDNGAFTVDRNNDVELGLRAKLRYNDNGDPENTFNSNGDGTYSFDVGPPGLLPFVNTHVWSFEWSINSSWTGDSGRVLSDLTYELGIGFDSVVGRMSYAFDPINAFYRDNAIGNNDTGNGEGAVANPLATIPGLGFVFGPSYETLIGSNNLAQNSWKPSDYITTWVPSLDGIYDFYLSAFDGSNLLAQTNMRVLVGHVDSPIATVPVPAPLALFGFGLLALGLLRRRKA